MLTLLRKLLPLVVVATLALVTMGMKDSIIQMGGEIPWPLSIQHAVTVKNSKGLWQLEGKSSSRLFNVEISSDAQSGFDWIRVAELNPKDYSVINWGEGYFSQSSVAGSPDSSYSTITLGPSLGKKDPHGRYLTMYSNGKASKHPYLIRMVEVETTLGNVLGLSLIEYSQNEFEHMLGTRVQKEPMSCLESDKDEKLDCYFEL